MARAPQALINKVSQELLLPGTIDDARAFFEEREARAMAATDRAGARRLGDLIRAIEVYQTAPTKTAKPAPAEALAEKSGRGGAK